MVRDVRVFDGERTIERANVVVRDGLIESVGNGRPTRDLPTIDGSGRTLLPGLIDTHAHVLTENGLRNGLRFGVTTQLDMFTRVEFAQSQRARRGQIVRTDLSDFWSAGNPATSPGGMGTQFGIPFATISNPDEAAAFVRARAAEGSDYLKILYEPGAGIVTTISYETLAALVAAARAQGLLSVVHVTSLEGARAVLAAGADGYAHFPSDSVIDETFARAIAAKGLFVTPTLSGFAAFGGRSLGRELAADVRIAPYLTTGQRNALESPPPSLAGPMGSYLTRFQIDRALENVRRLHAAGVRILAGDDAPNLGAHGASMHGELVLLTRAGLSNAEALRAATRAPADAFRLADRGRVAAGARADLLLVDGNPLVNIAATRAIVRVFKNGYDVPRIVPPTAPPQPR